jgi:hypothetical protein
LYQRRGLLGSEAEINTLAPGFPDHLNPDSFALPAGAEQGAASRSPSLVGEALAVQLF